MNKEYQIEIFSEWSDRLFEQFIIFKNKIQHQLENYFPEKTEDYKKYFEPNSPFMKEYCWMAFLLKKRGEIVAKAILCWKKEGSIANLGFIDWINSIEVARALMNEIELKAKDFKIKQIKTPVDLNFFVKYRIKCPGGGPAFYGEPVYPDYYHDLFKECGYDVVGEWDTYRLNILDSIKNFMVKRGQLKKRKHKNENKLKVRSLDLKKWDLELKTVYQLFVKSFEAMPEFEKISFDEFKVIYDDFKYIIHPWYALIVELNGVPVGFNINYPDPLPVLKKVKGKGLNLIQKLILLVRLRTNFTTLLIAYIGKVPGPDGEEIKGVTIKISRRLSTLGFIFKNHLVCYQSKDSPSRRVFDSGGFSSYSRYVLYGKNL